MSQENKGGIKRRDFLKIIGVAGGTAAVAGACSEPVEQIIPYVIPPEGIVPGVPNWYSSTCTECPAGCGILVKNREGRAIKIEGNPDSPINLGSTCARGQASLQGLYNPDRLRSPLVKNEETAELEPKGWDEAQKLLTAKVNDLQNKGKIAFLTNNISGSLGTLIEDWVGALGGTHIKYETFSHEPLKEANKISFGQDSIPTYRIDKADYLLSFGADFIETWLSPVEYTKQFSSMHAVVDKTVGKFVHIEPRASLTASNADEWVSVKPGTEAVLALGIAHQIVADGNSSSGGAIRGFLRKYHSKMVSEVTDVPEATIKRIAKEFADADSSLAIGGGEAVSGTNATETLVAINILNHVAGNIGETVNFGDSLTLSDASSFEDVEALVARMNSGDIEILFVYNVNPAFTLPSSLNFKEAIKNVPYVVSFSSFMDETTESAALILPDNTPLESWGDYSPKKSVRGLLQPVMSPVFNTRATGDVLLAVSAGVQELQGAFTQKTFYDYLQESWKKVWTGASGTGSFDDFWKVSLEKGGYYGEPSSVSVSLLPGALSLDFDSGAEFQGEGEFYFMAYPSYRYYDGRGANKPWLQELPDAITTGVWSSWVDVHPDTAKKLGVRLGDFLTLSSPHGEVQVQVYVYQGIRPDTLAVMIGQGHTSFGRYAKDRGVNPIGLLPVAKDKKSGGFAWLSTKVSAAKMLKHAQFVQTQYTTTQHDRDIAQAISLTELEKGLHYEEHHEPDFYPPPEYDRYRWAMNIDLQKCVGCGTCVTACYAENNIAFVGKDMVAMRRDMSWIRIERYFEESKTDAGFQTRFLPMLCQHCGNAPCEPVCPVYATYHNPEGLNGMVYNRCVGTRYCANNCTYKVRRFNWYTYKWPEPLNWQLNPDVTVRDKGVMEKCTFCVQRINYGRDLAKDDGRDIRDGDIQVACQQACPANAIEFGNLEDHESRVSKLAHDGRSYRVLEAINTQPGITYLKKVTQEKA